MPGNIIVPKVVKYPDRYPKPSKVSFGATTDYGLVVSEFDSGKTQQRYTGSNPTTANVQFRMSLEMYADWSAFINEYGNTSWMLVPMVSHGGGVFGLDDPFDDEIVRFGDHSMSSLGGDYVAVQVIVEFIPRDIGNGLPGVGKDIVYSPPTSKRWVIAGDPPSPSSDWVIGGTPASPSTPDHVIAGGPAAHA